MNSKQQDMIKVMLVNLVRVERRAFYGVVANKKQVIQKIIDDGFKRHLESKDDNI
ncbi:hypothetical protein ACO1PK_14875 [Alishewanella sp. d11]|uniref:hypothetical protein n=1 Tax=Alishewanella sp. d11 TaxID=3414030 RepID=UPI003BF85710